jgi:hypothetical protein
MDPPMFINDWHTIINFGPNNGKRLIDVDTKQYEWLEQNCRFGPVHEAIDRINNRKGVTTLIKKVGFIPSMPELILSTDELLPIIERPYNIDVTYYGYFIEFLVKYAMGVRHFSEVQEYLACRGLEVLPTGLKLNGPVIAPDQRCKFIYASYKKKDYDLLDICNFSFCPKLNMNKHIEKNAKALYVHIKNNLDYYQAYLLTLSNFKSLPKLIDKEQDLCDKISVGCVMGVIDMISNNTIIDVKCKAVDDAQSYRKQLYAYACLYLLRYGRKIEYCKIYNFLSGNVYILDVRKLSIDDAKNYVKIMGSYNSSHLKLFI